VTLSDRARAVALTAIAGSLVVSAACGKKGPPLAPLRLVPVAATDVAAQRSAEQVELHFTLPTANLNGPGKVDLDHVEIYAMTIAAGAVTPPNRELLAKGYVVGTMAVKPPPVEEKEPAANAPPDSRPSPGDRVTFVEQLTEEKLKPVKEAAPAPAAAGTAQTAATTTATAAGTPTAAAGATPPTGAPPPPGAPSPATTPPAPGAPPAGAPPAAGAPAQTGAPPAAPPAVAALPPAPPGFPYPVRIYVVRGVSRGGRPGAPSTRINVPLISPAGAPTAVVAQLPTEKAIAIEWTPPVAEPGASPLAFNVYRGKGAPLNSTPLSDVKFDFTTVEYGKEQCFTVRTIQTIQSVTIESDASAPACLTPIDKFPPEAPKGLRAVAEDGAVSLVWDVNGEADLAGYLVLRGEVEGGPLQPITPQLLKDANYRDTTTKAGVRYFYAVVAVDTATPRNTSAQSALEAVTAR
jgi:hypothetical protein